MKGDEGDDRSRTSRRRLLEAMGVTGLSGLFAGCTVNVDLDDLPIGGDGDGAAGGGDTAQGPSGDSAAGSSDTSTPTDGADGSASAEQVELQIAQAGTRPVGTGDCTFSLPDDPTVVAFGGDVTEDTTLGADADVVQIAGDVEVRGATLTVAPGTALSFPAEAKLVVRDGGALEAVGSCAEPILFSAEQATRGFWQGIFLRDNASLSHLSHVVVEYAGSGRFNGASEPGGLVVESIAKLTNSTMRENTDFGLVLEDSARLETVSENLLTANTASAIGTPRSVGWLDDASVYTGNDEDRVLVSHEAVDDDVAWAALDAPYAVANGAKIEVTSALTIDPGTTVAFGQGAGMVVDGGSLTAVGVDTETEESKPIVLTGTQKTRGYWRGIHFITSDRVENRLRNAVVEYGGGGDRYNGAMSRGNVVLSRESRVRVDGSTVRESAAYGVVFDDTSSVDSFVQSTVTRNADGAGRVAPAVVGAFSATSTFVGNDVDALFVRKGRMESDAEWDALDVPYAVEDGARVFVESHLTVAPGATVEFGQEASMIVEQSGALTAVGVDPDTEQTVPVTFTGVQQTRGYWRGLHFDDAGRAENRLVQAVVEYGGGGDQFSGSADHGNVVVSEEGRLTVQGCTIRWSEGYGIAAESSATVDAYSTSFVDNALGPEY